MIMEHVQGENKGNIVLYALSTCAWCKKTKKLLEELGVEFSYIYLDKLNDTEKEEAMQKIRQHNPLGNLPTIVIDEKKVIIGYKEERIRNILKSGIDDEAEDYSGMSEEELKNYFFKLLQEGKIDKLKNLITNDIGKAVILVDLLRNQDIFVRIGSSILIKNLYNEKPEELKILKTMVKDLLKERDSTVLQDAAMVLGKIGNKSDIHELEKLALSDDEDIREAAKEAIGEINSR